MREGRGGRGLDNGTDCVGQDFFPSFILKPIHKRFTYIVWQTSQHRFCFLFCHASFIYNFVQYFDFLSVVECVEYCNFQICVYF